VADAGLPLAVVTLEWSQGRIVADQTDWRTLGTRLLLASQIASYRQPTLAGHLCGRSQCRQRRGVNRGGDRPPGSVNRIILLARRYPATTISAALRGSKDGSTCLYVVTRLLSDSVWHCRHSDGCRGARPPAGSASGPTRSQPKMLSCMQAKATSWERCQARLEITIAHGRLKPGFLHTCVLPC